MSKDDFVTNEKLLNPYIEIAKYYDSNTNNHTYINVSTFEDCLSHLIPPFVGNEPTAQKRGKRLFAVYGVVGRTVKGIGGGFAYLNISERPISRTLMGYLTKDSLKEKLPTIHKGLTEKLE